MPAAMLDTLRCARTLQAAGFSQKQAEGTAQVLGEALTDVATKEDLAATKQDLRSEMNHGFATLKAEHDTTRQSLKADIAQLHTKFDALDRQIKFLFGFLGLLFAMAAYGFLELVSVASASAAPVQVEAAQPAPPEAIQRPPVEPSGNTAPT